MKKLRIWWLKFRVSQLQDQRDLALSRLVTIENQLADTQRKLRDLGHNPERYDAL